MIHKVVPHIPHIIHIVKGLHIGKRLLYQLFRIKALFQLIRKLFTGVIFFLQQIHAAQFCPLRQYLPGNLPVGCLRKFFFLFDAVFTQFAFVQGKGELFVYIYFYFRRGHLFYPVHCHFSFLLSAFSSGFAVPASACSPKCSLTLFSISSQTAGLSRRYCLAFSRPWPILLPS